MTNLVFGIIISLICMAGYIYSWRMQSRENYPWAILILVLCGFILRVFVATDLFLHPWDERFHALVAKNMMNHPFLPTLYENPVLPFDLKDWSANHIWVHKQPFPLWCMALSMKIFGINEIALRIPSLLASTFGIIAIYKVGEYLFSKKNWLFCSPPFFTSRIHH
jgi:4-amino-4-deoxy-L-arabinose transferase-like glycosyltransferase